MVREVKAFECEWCGRSYGSKSNARACEHNCIAETNRNFLVSRIGNYRVREPSSFSTVEMHRFQRIKLYDRLAKAHGIEQEKTDGEASS